MVVFQLPAVKPEVEYLGNNISDIIFDVFDVSSSESNYKDYLSSIGEKLCPAYV